MRPVTFKYQNKTLLKPPTRDMEECGSLPVNADGKRCVSCWRLGFRERIKVLLFGRVWLTVYSGGTQPPVAMYCGRKFLKKAK